MQFIRTRSMLIASAMVLIALAKPVFSQTAADTSSKDSAKRDDVSLLKQQVAEQQKEIEQLRTIVDQMKQSWTSPLTRRKPQRRKRRTSGKWPRPAQWFPRPRRNLPRGATRTSWPLPWFLPLPQRRHRKRRGVTPTHLFSCISAPPRLPQLDLWISRAYFAPMLPEAASGPVSRAYLTATASTRII